ncbi:MAG: YdcF family protein [Verrucomicrobiota bacterium]
MSRRSRHLLLWGLLALGCWLTGVGAVIRNFGTRDQAVKSDCIIVLGAAVQGDEPSPVFEERIRHGVHLYKEGLAPRILFTGGLGDGSRSSESAVGVKTAHRLGVPAAAMLMEEKSRTTRQNLHEARAVMRGHGLKSAIIVSDPPHLKRALMMAADLGMEAVPSPTPTSRYRSLKAKSVFLLREI